MVVSAAVEGVIDDAVVRRLLLETKHVPGPIHIKNGKPNVLKNLGGYNSAAKLSPWVVLLDLNGDADCAPSFIEAHLESPAKHMLLRLAVRQVEAWLLADRVRLARFLHVSQARVPRDPDFLADSKCALVDLARHSSDRRVREGLVPTAGSGIKVGPAYVAMLIDYIEHRWVPATACERSESLRRCVDRLSSLQ